jgi:hypothetical protein
MNIILIRILILLGLSETIISSSIFNVLFSLHSEKELITTPSFPASFFITSKNNIPPLKCVYECQGLFNCLCIIYTKYNASSSVCSIYKQTPVKGINLVAGKTKVE